MARFHNSLLLFVTLFSSSCFGADPVQPAKCGLTKVSRIVGGTTATDFYPWFVALVAPETRYRDHYEVACGAALITPKHVLTAAHCYHGRRPNKDEKLVVIDLTNRCNKGGKILETAAVEVHEKYDGNERTPEHDIALIYLKEAVSNMPICLPTKGRYVGKRSMIIGFGSTKLRSTYPCQMLFSEVDVIPKRNCVKGLSLPMADKTICAGKLDGGIDACDGDSGGPLMSVNSNGAYELIGIVSYGDGCGRRSSPGIYTDVTKRGFLHWVQKRIVNPLPTKISDDSSKVPSKPERPTLDNSPSFAGRDYEPPKLDPTSNDIYSRPGWTPSSYSPRNAQERHRAMQALMQAVITMQRADPRFINT